MSKLETVKTLDDTAPQLQIVRSVRDLQQTVTQMQQDLKTLPDAIAAVTAQSLMPLETLQQDVTTALQAFDRITATQRQALTELSEQIAKDATREMSKRVSDLDKTLEGLKPAATAIAEAAQKLDMARQQMTAASAAAAMPIWALALLTGAAGAVGALLTMIGQSVFGS